MDLDNHTLLERYAAEHYEPNSITLDRRKTTNAALRRLAERLDGRTLIELTPSDLMAWQGAELKRGIAPNTVRKKQNMIRSFIAWAYQAQLIDFERTTRLKSVNGVRGATTEMRPKPYKRSEIAAFREDLANRFPLMPTRGKGSRSLRAYLRSGNFSPQLRRHARRLQFEAQVALALEEGLRCIEIFHTTIEDMHSENECVVVRTAKSKPGEIREREVPMTEHARMCISEWLELRELLLPGDDFPWLALYHGQPRQREHYAHHKKALKVIGTWNWHRFRHTFATERLRAGMPLEQVRVMMGHARIEQTLAYAKIVSADVRSEALRTEADFTRNIGLDPTP